MCRTNLKNYIYINMYLYFLNFPRKQSWERNEAGFVFIDMYLLLVMGEERSLLFLLICIFGLEWERNEAVLVALFYSFGLEWERNEKTILICIVLTKTYLLFFFIIYKLKRLYIYIFFYFSFLFYILISLYYILYSFFILYRRGTQNHSFLNQRKKNWNKKKESL